MASYRTIFYSWRGSGPPAGEDGQREEAQHQVASKGVASSGVLMWRVESILVETGLHDIPKGGHSTGGGAPGALPGRWRTVERREWRVCHQTHPVMDLGEC